LILSVSSENFGIFEDFEIELSDGLNVFTGESGTGKSMFLKLLRLLCGHEVDLPIAAQRAYAEMVIDRDDLEPEIIAVKWLRGRSNFRLNRRSVRRAEVKEFCDDFVEFHAQGTSQSLSRRFELEILDSGLPEELLEIYRKTYKDYVETVGILKHHSSTAEIDKEIAFLSSEIEKIEGIIERVGNEEEFLGRVRAIENAEEISEKLGEIDSLLSEETVYNIQMALAAALHLQKLGFGELAERLSIVLDMVQEILSLVKKYENSEEFDVSGREAVLALADSLRWAKNKYGPTFEDVMKNLEDMKIQLKELAELKKRVATAEGRVSKLETELRELGEEIDTKRRTVAAEVEERAMHILERLGMGNVDMKFKFTPLEVFSFDGVSRVKLLVRTLSRAEFEPFDVVASGGERSRIYLALHLAKPSTALRSRKVLVFDELESGLGQRYADKLADLLKEAAVQNQLLVVTHLPQVAVAANAHFLVERVKDMATIRRIDGNVRRMEIEAMFGKMDLKEM